MTALTFQLTTEYIQLNNLLKVMSIGDSGGQAKHMIIQGLVKVNDKVEEVIRKKLVAGDIITYEDTHITILAQEQKE